MGVITDFDRIKGLEELVKAARREVKGTRALKRVVDFFGNQIEDTDGRLMFLTNMYKVEFFTEEEARNYQILADTIDFEIVKQLFKE